MHVFLPESKEGQRRLAEIESPREGYAHAVWYYIILYVIILYYTILYYIIIHHNIYSGISGGTNSHSETNRYWGTCLQERTCLDSESIKWSNSGTRGPTRLPLIQSGLSVVFTYFYHFLPLSPGEFTSFDVLLLWSVCSKVDLNSLHLVLLICKSCRFPQMFFRVARQLDGVHPARCDSSSPLWRSREVSAHWISNTDIKYDIT